MTALAAMLSASSVSPPALPVPPSPAGPSRPAPRSASTPPEDSADFASVLDEQEEPEPSNTGAPLPGHADAPRGQPLDHRGGRTPPTGPRNNVLALESAGEARLEGIESSEDAGASATRTVKCPTDRLRSREEEALAVGDEELMHLKSSLGFETSCPPEDLSASSLHYSWMRSPAPTEASAVTSPLSSSDESGNEVASDLDEPGPVARPAVDPPSWARAVPPAVMRPAPTQGSNQAPPAVADLPATDEPPLRADATVLASRPAAAERPTEPTQGLRAGPIPPAAPAMPHGHGAVNTTFTVPPRWVVEGASDEAAPFAGSTGTTAAELPAPVQRISEAIVDQLVKPVLQALGIDPAKVASTMEIVASDRSPSSAAGAGENEPALAAGASRTMEHVMRTAELMRAADRAGVQLRLDFGDSGPLSVQITLRQGRVHTLFRSDSPELRDSIANAWTSFAQRSDGNGVSLAEPVLMPLRAAASASSEGGRAAGGFGQADAEGRSGREARSAAGEQQAGFARGTRRRAVAATQPTLPRHEISVGHLRVHA